MITYTELGICPLINAPGIVTSIDGSTMAPEVMEAMNEAGRYYAIQELQEAAGKYIAKRLGVEVAFISSGAAAGLALAAAACMSRTVPASRAQLPNTEGLKSEIVAFRPMRSSYDQAVRVAGARLVEIGLPEKTELWELEHGLTARTAAVLYIVEHEYSGGLPLGTVLGLAHARGVPVIVDAAAELPSVENLWRYSQLGADLTVFSGGKDIRGPQSTGLIVGREDLIKGCAFNSCHNHSIGRAMKVDKEEVIGLVDAMDMYLSQDFKKEMEVWESQVKYVIDALSRLPGVTAKRLLPGPRGIQPTCIPRAGIEWSPSVTLSSPIELTGRQLRGDPRVAVGTSSSGIVVNPQMLEEGQERVVVDSIRDALLGRT